MVSACKLAQGQMIAPFKQPNLQILSLRQTLGCIHKLGMGNH